MKDVCMPVVEVSQGDFKVIYWREISGAMNLVPQQGKCASEAHDIFSTNISKNCIILKSHWFL